MSAVTTSSPAAARRRRASTDTRSVLFDAPGPKGRARNVGISIGAIAAAIGLLAVALFQMGTHNQLQPFMWLAFLQPDTWLFYLIPGLIATFQAALASVVLAGIFGIAFGAGRLSRNPWIRRPCGVVVEFFRSVPVLIMMIFAYRVYSSAGWFVPSINPLLGVVTALTLYNGSVIAELVRSGVHALPKGQSEAGLSIGLTRGQTLRLIQLPQSLVAMLPALIAQLVVVLKDTALGYIIFYPELVSASKILGSNKANTVPAYIVAAMLFIVINYGVTKMADVVERRLRRTAHTAGPVTHAASNTLGGTGQPGASATAGLDDLVEVVEEHREHREKGR